MGTNMNNYSHNDLEATYQEDLPKTIDERLNELESKMQQIVVTASQPASTSTASTGLQMIEDKLGSLNAWMQIEAKSRASMSALYDREFLRVGQDMYFTKKNVEALYANMQQQPVVPAEALSAIGSGDEQVNELKDRISDLELEVAEEREKRSKLSELVSEKLQSLAVTLKDCNATSLSFREELCELSCALQAEKEERINDVDSVKKTAAKSHDKAEQAKQECVELRDSTKLLPEQLKNHISQQIEDELVEINEKQEDMSRYIMSLAERIDTLKPPSPATEKGSIEEFRATITSFDTEIEGVNARIGKIEKGIADGDGINDKRLTDLEVQLEKSNKRHNTLAQKSVEDRKKNDDRLKGVEARLKDLVDGMKMIWKM
ncbi:hypothetical protein LTR78_007627 [Recurvomyces mirabilis]|uniref:Uncharacterized protein n=1 Tax=Recurvomyces mirabilis TaxID=574656 RepID=A0AAE0TUB7_9PEZI|nr:hypothetical protein LTR78_007627 [Recurvomyces mirabilis]KAK5159862.1 hypothetical protein LTS14_001967 [Recurvomyces mirabilis]